MIFPSRNVAALTAAQGRERTVQMPGPAPSPQRRRRNADTYADVQATVKATKPEPSGPSLVDAMGPAYQAMAVDVRELVEHWWQTWRRSPLSAVFLETDWSRLAMLAPLVASYFARPHYTKLAEIRQNEALLGATHVDRLKARIKVEQTPAEAGPAPTDDTKKRESRRLRLAG
jgi:hypothetical protein